MRWTSLSIAFVAALLSYSTAHAQAPWTVRWEAEPSAAHCGSADTLQRALDQHSNAHLPTSEEGNRIPGIVTVHLSRVSTGYVMRLSVQEAEGRSLGERVLNDPSATCEQLEEAAALALQLLLDPQNESAQPREEAQKSNAASVSTIMVVAQDTALEDDAAPALRTKQRALSLALGGVATSGLVGAFAGHAALRTRFESRHIWPLEAWFTAFGQATTQARYDSAGDVTVTPFLAALATCPFRWHQSRMRASSCLGLEGGILRARGAGFTSKSSRAQVETMAAVVSLPASYAVARHFSFGLAFELGFPFIYQHFDALDANGTRHTIWKTTPVYGALSVLAAWNGP